MKGIKNFQSVWHACIKGGGFWLQSYLKYYAKYGERKNPQKNFGAMIMSEKFANAFRGVCFSWFVDIRKLSNGTFFIVCIFLKCMHINYLIDSHNHEEFSYPFSWIIYAKEPSRYLHIILIHSFICVFWNFKIASGLQSRLLWMKLYDA